MTSSATKNAPHEFVSQREDSELCVLVNEDRLCGQPRDAAIHRAELQCAGLEGCHELEGVMYDLFVHDPNCPKGATKPFSEIRKELHRAPNGTDAEQQPWIHGHEFRPFASNPKMCDKCGNRDTAHSHRPASDTPPVPEAKGDVFRGKPATFDYPPEDCCLVAHDTGEGWALTVEDSSHETIAYLAWPTSFGESQTAAELQAKGFIIV